MSDSIQHGFKRSALHWYPDGNIVLQAGKTQFRVHKSLLEKHLPVFADAFNFETDSENVDGWPVVKLTGDRAEDWENLLMTVYTPFTFYTSTMDYPMPCILSTLRLADKYSSDHLRDMAAACLRKNIPQDLDAATTLLRECWFQSPDLVPHFVEYIFDILDAALDLRIQSIVPTACLICMTYMGLAKILDGHTRSDGSISSLSSRTSRMLILARQSMLVSAIETVTRPMSRHNTKYCELQYPVDSAPGDYEIYDCDERAHTREHTQRSSRVAANPADIFLIGDIELCGSCARPINAGFNKAREELWDRVPSFFGLPQWDELKDFDA